MNQPTSHDFHPGSKRILQNRRALVVENDPLCAKLLAILLIDAGCQVIISPTAEDALDVLDAFRPDVVLMDLVLPRMSGLLLTEHIKHSPDLRDLVVVAVSSVARGETERVILEAGCAAFVRKPINILTFAQTVANCLGEKS